MEIGRLLSSSRDRLIDKLKNFAYRHAWVDSHVKEGIAFQLRALRKREGLDQKGLAKKVFGNPECQSIVSRYENPDYGKYSLSTLLDLAKAFDVALIVRFAPFSELVKWEEQMPSTGDSVASFTSELANKAFEATEVLAQTPVNVVGKVADTLALVPAQFYRPKRTSLVAAKPMSNIWGMAIPGFMEKTKTTSGAGASVN